MITEMQKVERRFQIWNKTRAARAKVAKVREELRFAGTSTSVRLQSSQFEKLMASMAAMKEARLNEAKVQAKREWLERTGR